MADPKRFLKKGEGLKRFAAYNPPLPRKTFVRFQPNLPSDESLNISLTDTPKIGPPKTIHTPIRPNRAALAALNANRQTSESPNNSPTSSESTSPEIHQVPKKYNLRTTAAAPALPKTARVPKVRADLSRPQPGNCMLALGKQIEKIEATVNELQERVKNCHCGILSTPLTTKQPRTRARSKLPTNATNQPPKILTALVNELQQLRNNFEELSIGK